MTEVNRLDINLSSLNNISTFDVPCNKETFMWSTTKYPPYPNHRVCDGCWLGGLGFISNIFNRLMDVVFHLLNKIEALSTKNSSLVSESATERSLPSNPVNSPSDGITVNEPAQNSGEPSSDTAGAISDINSLLKSVLKDFFKGVKSKLSKATLKKLKKIAKEILRDVSIKNLHKKINKFLDKLQSLTSSNTFKFLSNVFFKSLIKKLPFFTK